MAHLEVSEPVGDRQFPLTQDTVVIGAARGCDVVLTDAGVSAEHCEIQREGAGWRVVDLESRSGTRLNGTYVNQAQLCDGDELQLGITKIRMRFDAADSALPPVPGAPGTPTAGKTAARSAKRSPSRGAPAVVPAIPAPQAGGRAAPARASRTAGRGDAPPSRRGRRAEAAADDGYDDSQEEERPRRGRARRSDAPVVVVLALVGLVVLGFFVWLAVRPDTSINRDVVKRMLAAEKREDFQTMLDAAREADPADQYEYERIQQLKEIAERGVNAISRGDRVKEATDRWNSAILYHQSHFKDTEGFVARIDAFLGEFGDLECTAVNEATQRRVKLTGELGGAASSGKPWDDLKETLTLLGKEGKWFEVFEKLTAFEKESGTGVSYGDISTLRGELEKESQQWFGLQLSRAQMKAAQGDLFNARKILQRAADGLRTEEAARRASEKLAELEANR